jgi:tetratricopeptide (TPR) repeat protein
LGWILVNQQSPDNDQAIKLLKESIKADPDRFEAYNELGIAYKRKHMYEDAIKTYKEGIKRGDTSAMIYFNLGVSEYRNGNSSDAKTSFKKAISLDSKGKVGRIAKQWLNQI